MISALDHKSRVLFVCLCVYRSASQTHACGDSGEVRIGTLMCSQTLIYFCTPRHLSFVHLVEFMYIIHDPRNDCFPCFLPSSNSTRITTTGKRRPPPSLPATTTAGPRCSSRTGSSRGSSTAPAGTGFKERSQHLSLFLSRRFVSVKFRIILIVLASI